MRPTQGKFTAITGTREFFKLSKHCFHNLILGINNIKRTHEFQVFPRNSIMNVLQKEYYQIQNIRSSVEADKKNI